MRINAVLSCRVCGGDVVIVEICVPLVLPITPNSVHLTAQAFALNRIGHYGQETVDCRNLLPRSRRTSAYGVRKKKPRNTSGLLAKNAIFGFYKSVFGCGCSSTASRLPMRCKLPVYALASIKTICNAISSNGLIFILVNPCQNHATETL